MKEIPKNCRECGLKLERYFIYADEVKVLFMDSMGGSSYRLDSPFNEKTGKRNKAETYTCPKWKTRFILGSNNHDKIVFYKNDLHYL